MSVQSKTLLQAAEICVRSVHGSASFPALAVLLAWVCTGSLTSVVSASFWYADGLLVGMAPVLCRRLH